MNPDFVRLAHRKAIWAEIQRVLLDKYVASDGPPKEEIVCEEVPYSQKDVTNEAVLEVLEIIQQHELDENLEMRQYEFKKRKQPDAKRNEEQPAADSQPDAPGPQPAFSRIANGDGGSRRPAFTQPAAVGEPSGAPSGSQEEGTPPSDAERQPAPALAHHGDRARAKQAR